MLIPVLAVISLSVGLAFLAESLVEYLFGTLFDKIPSLEAYKWTLIYVSMGVGILMAFHYQLDLIALIANLAEYPIEQTWLGILLTGVVIGRGANFVHQFVSEYLPKKA